MTASLLIYRTHPGHSSGRSKGLYRGALRPAARHQPGGPIVLVWDNLATHTSRATRELIAARLWLTACQLPPTRPSSTRWRASGHIPNASLVNLAKRNFGQLAALVKTRLKRMQYRPGLINGFLAKTRLRPRSFVTPPLRIFRF